MARRQKELWVPRPGAAKDKYHCPVVLKEKARRSRSKLWIGRQEQKLNPEKARQGGIHLYPEL